MKIYNSHFKAKKCEMHLCLRHTMRMCRGAGVFPVDCLEQSAIDHIRISRNPLHSFFYLATVTGQIILALFSLYRFVAKEICLANLTNFLFNMTGLVAAILLLKLSRNWPQLVLKAYEIEKEISEIRISKNLSTKTTSVAYIVMFLAMVENILCIIFNIHLVMTCTENSRPNVTVFERYCANRMPYIYDYIDFTVWKAILFELINLQSTFLWNIIDVITMCFSSYLISYFQDFNRKLFSYYRKDNIDWGYLRMQFSKTVALLRLADDHANGFICLSFFSNLFFICVQLFNTLSKGYSGHRYNCDEESLTMCSDFVAKYVTVQQL